MAWLCSQDAAAHLGISDRTLRRRLRAGQYNFRREGRMHLVELDVPDDTDRLADVGEHFAQAAAATAITSRTTADTMAALSASQRETIRMLKIGTAVTAAVGVLATVMLCFVGRYMYLRYDATRNELSDARRQHVRQVSTLERERDVARQAVVQANSRTAAAEAQAAEDSARIAQINEALAGMAIPVEPAWTLQVAAAGE